MELRVENTRNTRNDCTVVKLALEYYLPQGENVENDHFQKRSKNRSAYVCVRRGCDRVRWPNIVNHVTSM